MIVIPFFYPKIGGLENYALTIAKELIKHWNWEVCVVTSNHLHKKYVKETIEGMTVYRLPYLLKLSNTPVHPLWYFQLLKIIEKEKPDIVNGHTPVPYIADVAALAARATNTPFVLTYQNDLEKSDFLLSIIVFAYSLVFKLVTLPLSKKVIVTTEYFLKKSGTFANSKKKIVVIPPGVYLDDTKPLETMPSKCVLFVGSLEKTHSHKGLTYLLQAVADVKNTVPDIQLVVVGKGNGLNGYKEEAQKLGIKNNVTFSGFIPDAELGNYYNNTNVVVLPSTNNSEGFGMVLIEAASYGKPVIATRVGGVPYVVDNNITGLLIKPADVNELATAITLLVTDTKLANQLGSAAKKKVQLHYKWETQAEKTNTVLNQL